MTVFAFLIMATVGMVAAPVQAADGVESTSDLKLGRWGLETSVTFPIVRIFMVQGSYAFWQYGEGIVGLCFQNWKDMGPAQGQAEAYTLLLGYRQYLWRGLHLEGTLFPAYNRFHSSVDDRRYAGLELWGELYIGYKISFALGGRTFFVIPQPGIGFSIFNQRKWPGYEAIPIYKPLFIPQLLVGVEL